MPRPCIFADSLTDFIMHCERYVRLALVHLQDRWKVVLTDGTHPLAFIGAYESRQQMIVSVVPPRGAEATELYAGARTPNRSTSIVW